MKNVLLQLLTCSGLTVMLTAVTATHRRAGAERPADVLKTLLKGMEYRAESIGSGRMFELRERYFQPPGNRPLEKHAALCRFEFDGPLFRNEEWLLTPRQIEQRKVMYRATCFDGEQYYEFEASDASHGCAGAVTTSITHEALGPVGMDLQKTRRALQAADPRVLGRETVFGYDCYHLTDTGPDGTQAHWWVAPQLGYLFVKLQVIMPHGSPNLEEDGARKESLWRGLRFEQVDGFWVRTVTRLDKKVVLPDGAQEDLVCEVNEVRDVTLNVGQTSSAFRYEFPLGTTVLVENGKTYRVGGPVEKAKSRLSMSSLAQVRTSFDREFPLEGLDR